MKEGDEFPKGIEFVYVPYEPANAGITACGIPITLDVDRVIEGKKVVIVSVPGAFTPTCTAEHIPPFGKELEKLHSKGVDDVIVLSANDPFVLSAWAKALGLFDKFKFATDPNASFSNSIGLAQNIPKNGFGQRTKRFALIVDHGKVTYIGAEPAPGVTVSGVDAILAKL